MWVHLAARPVGCAFGIKLGGGLVELWYGIARLMRAMAIRCQPQKVEKVWMSLAGTGRNCAGVLHLGIHG